MNEKKFNYKLLIPYLGIVILGFMFFNLSSKYNDLQKAFDSVEKHQLQLIDENLVLSNELEKAITYKVKLEESNERISLLLGIIDSISKNRYNEEVDRIPSSDVDRIEELFARYYPER